MSLIRNWKISWALVALVAAVGCGDTTTKPKKDLAVAHDLAKVGDMEVEQPDEAVPEDMAVPPDAAVPIDIAGGTNINLQVLSLSDWHGQIDPLSVNGADVGGAGLLSAYFKRDRGNNPNTITLTAGDSFGATPPLSGFFDDEPAVKALGAMGLTADTLGNHNFDNGITKLQSLIDKSTYPYVISNLDNLPANLKNVKSPFHIIDVNGLVKVGLIGVIDTDAPSLVFPGRMGTLVVTDPVKAANDAASMARANGAQIVICLAHIGALASNNGVGATGPLMDFATKVTGIDLILGDHTDILVNQEVNGAVLVVENKSKGATYGRITLTYNTATMSVIRRKAEIVTPYKCVPGNDAGCSPTIAPDAAIDTLMASYRTMLAAKFDQKIGVATALFERGNNVERLREVAIGDLTADAMRDRYKTQLAMVNGGGIRAPLPSAYLPADKSLRRTTTGYLSGPPYDLVIGDVYTVFPFGNSAITRTVTGEQVWALLEKSVGSLPAPFGGFAQISGFKFTFDSSKPSGSRVLSVSLETGVAIPKDKTTYTFCTTDFTNSGGDGYTMLADGQGVTREKQADILLDYIKAKMNLSPGLYGRIMDVGPPSDGGTAVDMAGAKPDMAVVPDMATATCNPKVNEIQAGGSSSATDEFVEIYNPCSTAINLKTWTLVYRSAANNSGAGNADTTMFGFPTDLMVASKGYVIITGANYSGTGASDGKFTNQGMAATGGAVGLRNAGGTLVDSVSYGTLTAVNNLTEKAPAPAPADGKTIGRIPDGTDTDDNSANFKATTSPTPRAANK